MSETITVTPPPPLSPPPATEPDPCSAFGLTRMPFTREIQTSQMWTTPDLAASLSGLETTVSARMSAAIIAPSGAGKTALLRRLVDGLPEARYRVAEMKVTAVGKRDLYHGIAAAVGMEPVGTWPKLLASLQAQVASLAETEARRQVLVIDEAQDMRPEVLVTLRVLTNFALDSKLMLSIVLAGDRRFEELLQRPQLEPLRNRLALVARLRLLTRDETASYIAHRLDIVGARTPLFDEGAIEAVFDMSRGNLRAIDHLSRLSLMWAAAKKLSAVDAGAVTCARKQIL